MPGWDGFGNHLGAVCVSHSNTAGTQPCAHPELPRPVLRTAALEWAGNAGAGKHDVHDVYDPRAGGAGTRTPISRERMTCGR
ncbi:hypothetical protein GCM10009612_12640 [Streptomyces beijiangensis]